MFSITLSKEASSSCTGKNVSPRRQKQFPGKQDYSKQEDQEAWEWLDGGSIICTNISI